MDVSREIVVHVLKCGGVSVAERVTNGVYSATLIKDMIVETQEFPEIVPRRLVMRLANKFNVPREHFWHPEMIPKDQQVSAPPAVN